MHDLQLQHPLWHLCGLALVVLLLAVQRRAKSSGILVLALWNLTGVILHELAHLLVGMLFRAGPTGFSLVPRRKANAWRLGSVTFARITAINAVPVALAPLGLAGVAVWVAWRWPSWYPPSLTTTIALYAALYFLLYNALPSRQDLRVACNWRSLLFYPLLGAALWYFVWPAFRGGFLEGWG
jgi:hypothetical protein